MAWGRCVGSNFVSRAILLATVRFAYGTFVPVAPADNGSRQIMAPVLPRSAGLRFRGQAAREI
jgi:hypothetical protein